MASYVFTDWFTLGAYYSVYSEHCISGKTM